MPKSACKWSAISKWTAFFHDKAANFAVIIGLAALPVLGLAGVALDYSRASRVRTTLQATLDAALVFGARQPVGARIAAATNGFRAQWSAPEGVTATTSFAETSTTTLDGTASATVATSVSGVLGFRTIDVSAKGTVTVASTALPCIYVLDQNASPGLLVNSGANVQAPNCEVHVASTGNPAATFNAGAAINSKKLCIKGTQIIRNGGTYSNLALGCDTFPDPYASQLPTPATTACTYNNLNYSLANVSLSPGVYCGWFNFNSAPNVTFAPGLYVIKGGGWNVNGGVWSGNGVTFYFADTSVIQFNSAVKTTLAAPTTGQWANFLFAEAPGLAKTAFILNNSNGQNFSGIVYLPTKNMTINSVSTVTAEGFSLVVNTLIFNNVLWNINGVAANGTGPSASAPRLSQ